MNGLALALLILAVGFLREGDAQAQRSQEVLVCGSTLLRVARRCWGGAVLCTALALLLLVLATVGGA